MGSIKFNHTLVDKTFLLTAGKDGDSHIPTSLNIPDATAIADKKTYIDKIRKGTPSSYNNQFYYSNVGVDFLKTLYAYKNISIGGSSIPLYAALPFYNEATGEGTADILFITVVGTGGNAGNTTSYGTGKRTGGGGGGGGGGIAIVSSSQPITYVAERVSNGSFQITVSSGGRSFAIVGNVGGNGGNGASNCSSGAGSAGSAGGCAFYLDDGTSYTNGTYNINVDLGNMKVVAVIGMGGNGGAGARDGNGSAGNSTSVSLNSSQNNTLGISGKTWSNSAHGSGLSGGGGAGFYDPDNYYGKGGNRSSSGTSGSGSAGTTGCITVTRQNGTRHVFTNAGWIS